MESALAYGFFGSNHGDVAITRGALAVMRAAGCAGTIQVVSHRLQTPVHRNAVAFTREQDANIALHAWDTGLSALRSDEPPHPRVLDDILGSQALCESFAAAMGITGAHTLFYGGGENLFSYGRAPDEWKLLGRLLPLLVAHARGAQLIGLGATFGPFESELSLGWARRLVDAATLLVVRDARSLRLVAELCGARDHVRLGLDSAFFVPGLPAPERPPTEPVKPPARVALVPRLDGMGLRVGPAETTARIDALRAAGTQQTEAYRLYLSIARALLERGMSIDVICQTDADVQLTEELATPLIELGGPARVKLLSSKRLESFHRLLCRCDLVVASRLHSLIFAAQHGIPGIGLVFEEHGHKTPGVMEVLEMNAWCFDARQTPLETVTGAIEDALAHRPELSRALAATVARLRAELHTAVAAALRGR